MSIEIANELHALATVNLANVADSAILVKNCGFAAAARASTGIFTFTLLTPLDSTDGVVFVQHAAQTSRIVVAALLTLASAGDDNIQVNGFTDAGAAADTGLAYLSVYRYPVGA